MNKERRTHNEIRMNILEVLLFNRLSMKFTPLMQKSNTQGSKLKAIHIPYLLDQGWIREPNLNGEYEITIKGIRRYIEFMAERKIIENLSKLHEDATKRIKEEK